MVERVAATPERHGRVAVQPEQGRPSSGRSKRALPLRSGLPLPALREDGSAKNSETPPAAFLGDSGAFPSVLRGKISCISVARYGFKSRQRCGPACDSLGVGAPRNTPPP